MTAENRTPESAQTFWRVLGESVRGAAHQRTDMPNQDSIDWQPQDSPGLPLILAVSDGHGSERCIRSDRGSKFAVAAALQIVGEFLDRAADVTDHAELEQAAREHLPRTLVRTWESRVEEDLRARPFEEKEWAKLEAREGGASAREKVEAYPTLAYGATLLAVAVTERHLLYLQLGDGDILTVSPEGKPERPLPPDPQLMANETTSLCSPSAFREVRIRCVPLNGSSPALILVSTDGLSNSFRSDEGFFKVGPDILTEMRNRGWGHMRRELIAFLEETSRQGSGDDITLGILKRAEDTDIETIVRQVMEAEMGKALAAQSALWEERIEAKLQDARQQQQEREKRADAVRRKRLRNVIVGLCITAFLAFLSGGLAVWALLRSPASSSAPGAQLSPAPAGSPAAVSVPPGPGAPTPPASAPPPSAPPPSVSATPALIVSPTEAGAYKKIADALRDAKHGARIEVRAGVYTESLVLDKPVQIQGAGRDKTVIETRGQNCVLLTADRASMAGLTLRNTPGQKQQSAVDVPEGQLILTDCDISSESYFGVSVHGPQARAILKNCDIRSKTMAALAVRDHARVNLSDCKLAAETGPALLEEDARLSESDDKTKFTDGKPQ